jgi:hypothetical protein
MDRKRPARHDRQGHIRKTTGKAVKGSLVNPDVPPNMDQPSAGHNPGVALGGQQLSFDDISVDALMQEAVETADGKKLEYFASHPEARVRVAATKNREVPLPHRRALMEDLIEHDGDVAVKVAAISSGYAAQDAITYLWDDFQGRPFEQVGNFDARIKRAMAEHVMDLHLLHEMSTSDDWAFRAGAARNRLADDEGISETLADDPEVAVVKEVAATTKNTDLLDRLANHPASSVLVATAENEHLNQRKNIHLLYAPTPDQVRYAFAAHLKHADILHTEALRSNDTDALFGIMHNKRTFTHTLEFLETHSNKVVAEVAKMRPGRPKENT